MARKLKVHRVGLFTARVSYCHAVRGPSGILLVYMLAIEFNLTAHVGSYTCIGAYNLYISLQLAVSRAKGGGL